MEQPPMDPGLLRRLIALVAFSCSFGFVEAAVVVYLREIYEPLHHRLHPNVPPGELFPLVRLDQLHAAGPPYGFLLGVELVREAATLIMLAALGVAAARTFRGAFAAFVVAFGVWDLVFYGALKLLLDWPASLWTWDLLFLLPVPWSAPVLAPMIVAATMVVTGTLVLHREASGAPAQLEGRQWTLIVCGGLLLVLAFCWDFQNIMAGARPRPFPWPLFWAGQALGIGGVALALGRTRRGLAQTPAYEPFHGTSATPAR